MPDAPESSLSRTTGEAYTNMLSIKQLVVDVLLGVGEEERRAPQKVVFDIRFYLPSLLSSAEEDHGDYICYHGVSEKIHALCIAKEYRLIEYLAHEVYRLIRSTAKPEVKIWVRVSKPYIQLPYVEKGASYTFTDLPPFSWVVPE